MNRPLFFALLCASTVALSAHVAQAQTTSLASALGNVPWGASSDELFSDRRALIMDEYRADIHGLRDPIEIDRHRSLADDRYESIRDSLETFPELRTGYEVSVIGGEIAGARGQSLVTVREELTTLYYVFTDDRLTKLMVVYRLDDLDWVGFEGFVERLSQLFGRPDESAYEVDDIGIRRLQRAEWNDGATALRIEDLSQMFASYMLVYRDATLADITVDVDSLAETTRPTAGRDVGEMMRRLQNEQDPNGNEGVVDAILGERTEVELRLRSDDDDIEPVVDDGDGRSALDDDEDLDDVERADRPARRTPSTTTTVPEETETEDDGIIIH